MSRRSLMFMWSNRWRRSSMLTVIHHVERIAQNPVDLVVVEISPDRVL